VPVNSLFFLGGAAKETTARHTLVSGYPAIIHFGDPQPPNFPEDT